MSEPKRKTILLVEDEALIAMMEKCQLEKAGYEVVQASNGEIAIQMVTAEMIPIDLILMDIDLGEGMDGTESALEILRTHEIPILFLSGHTEKDIVEKTEAITNYGYVVKNSSFTVLDASIKMAFKLFAEQLNTRNQKETLRTMLHSIGDAIIATDVEGNITQMNPVAEELTGWQFEEVRTKPLTTAFNIVNAQTRSICDNPIERVLKNNEVLGLANHTILIAKDGTEYQIADSSAPIKDIYGTVTGVVLVFRDVTEEYLIQEDLKKSEYEYRSTVDGLLTGVVVHDAESRILISNPEASKILGLTSDQMSGKDAVDPAWMFVYENLSPMKLEDYPVSRVIASGNPLTDYVFGIIRPDRVNITWVNANALPLFDAEHKLEKIVINFVDITARRQAERETAVHAAVTDLFLQAAPLETTCQKVTERLAATLDFPMAAIELYDASHGEMVFLGVTGMPMIRVEQRVPVQQTISGTVAVGNKVFCETRAMLRTESQFGMLRQLGADTFVCVPMQIDNEVLGTLSLADRRSRVDADLWIPALQAIAIKLSLEIKRKRMEYELKNRNDELAESETRFNLAIKATGAGLWDWDMINDRVYYSPQWKKMLGYEDHEVENTFAGWKALWHPDDTARIELAIKDHLEGRSTSYEVEHRLRHKNGSWRWILTRGEIQKDSEGKPFRWTGTNLDITERKLVELTLCESETELKKVQKISHVGSWHLDIATNEVVWSEELYAMYGFDPALPPPPYTEHMKLFTPESWEILQSSLARTRETGIPYELELKTIKQDGRNGWMWVRGEATRNSEGTITGLWGAAQDITERKRLEHELEARNEDLAAANEELLSSNEEIQATIIELLESEKKLARSEAVVRNKLKTLIEPEGDLQALGLADILDSETMQSLMNDLYAVTKIGIGIIDTDGKVLVATGWQDICTKFHRCNPETLKNCIESDIVLADGVPAGTYKAYRCKNNMWDISTPIILGGRHVGNIFLGQFVYDDEQPDLALFRNQARRYGFDEAEYLAALARVPRWSRKTVDTAIKFYSRLAVMISELSYSTIKLAKTLAEKGQTEAALRANEFFVKSLLRSLPVPVFYKDIQGRYSGCNQAFESFVGRTQEELIGKTVFDINPAKLAQTYQKSDRELLSSPSRQVYESQVENNSGELRNVIFHKASLTDAAGAVTGLVGAILDITERMRAEEKIKSLLDDKELILKEVHHRIKNYMNTIYSLLFLQAETQEIPSAKSTLLDAADRVQSMLRLYDKLYRSEGDGSLPLKEYLPALIDEILRIFPQSGSVKIIASIDDIVYKTKVLSSLSIILNELITNSMKYAFMGRSGGAIALSCTRNEHRTCIVYDDEGPGIPATVTFENSTGFGMQLVQMMILQLHGAISIDQGKRSRIIMEIPE